ncbi:hypothetical protein QN372_00245 [Undibacterium sp. RTI2.1]|uniref:hypothetical protein n=1 Tax=unclassified Undibacterium TaxID=2630295 RepID=UPI002B228CC4|nr:MULTISPECIES: hypothetical protein [unclassified Undibacterium]MEB0029168.1 hypothetical protein [Undibacterium sp. RTI2.1]MEB0115476.1 hypothetical protein [Undibacterium sp. RTI2.2]
MEQKLRSLSVEALISLGDAVQAVLKEKLPMMLRVGKICTFVDKQGETTAIVITKVNQTTYSGYIYNLERGTHHHNQRWKISKSICRPYFPPSIPKPMPTGVGKDKPAVASQW